MLNYNINDSLACSPAPEVASDQATRTRSPPTKLRVEDGFRVPRYTPYLRPMNGFKIAPLISMMFVLLVSLVISTKLMTSTIRNDLSNAEEAAQIATPALVVVGIGEQSLPVVSDDAVAQTVWIRRTGIVSETSAASERRR